MRTPATEPMIHLNDPAWLVILVPTAFIGCLALSMAAGYCFITVIRTLFPRWFYAHLCPECIENRQHKVCANCGRRIY